jgi:hypothetical protein
MRNVARLKMGYYPLPETDGLVRRVPYKSPVAPPAVEAAEAELGCATWGLLKSSYACLLNVLRLLKVLRDLGRLPGGHFFAKCC